MRIAVVYRYYAADDDLLYVGLTTDPVTRLSMHAAYTVWWELVDHMEYDAPLPIGVARRSERLQIQQLAPRFNKVGNVRRGWDYGARGTAYFPEKDQFRACEAVLSRVVPFPSEVAENSAGWNAT